MQTNGDINSENAVKECCYWHILVHPSPALVGKLFKTKQSKDYNPSADDGLLPPCRYHIPYNEINWKPSITAQPAYEDTDRIYDPVMDGNALRSDFRGFIFVYGTDSLAHQLVASRLNKSLRIPIRYYYDTDGQPVKITNVEMERFRSAVMQQDFQICQGYPLQEIVLGDRVVIVDGAMKGSTGEVLEIRYDHQGMKFKIAFLMFNNKLQIAVPGFRANQVRLQDPDTKQLLEDPIISNFENEIFELLHHRYGAKGSAKLPPEDEKRLKFLYRYSSIVFEDDPVSTAKFTALMLICAYLMKDKEATECYVGHVQDLLQGATEATTALQAYLLAALFVVLHNPMLRNTAKAYRQTHPNCPQSLCRLISIAKRI